MKGFITVIAVAVFAVCLAAIQESCADDSEIQRYRNYVTVNAGQSDVNLVPAYHRLGVLYFQRGDKNEAVRCFSSALSLATPRKCAEISLDYAALLLESRNTGDGCSGVRQAELIVKQALVRVSENDPHRDDLEALLARCLVCQDRIIEAKRLYRLSYSEMETNQRIASIYRDQRRFDDAKYFESKIPTPRTIALAAGALSSQALPKASVIPSKTSGHTVAVSDDYRAASANDKPKRNLHYVKSLR